MDKGSQSIVGDNIERRTLMEIQEITVYRKSDDTLITHIFQDGESVKQITSDDYVVEITLKDPHDCEPNA